MALKLSFEVFDFFWNAGVTLATFKSDGKIELSIQKFIFSWKCLANISEFFFRTFIEISFCYIVFAVCSFLLLKNFFITNIIKTPYTCFIIFLLRNFNSGNYVCKEVLNVFRNSLVIWNHFFNFWKDLRVS